MLCDPGRHVDDHGTVAQLFDPDRRFWCVQHKGQIRHGFQSQCLRLDQVGVIRHAQINHETTFVIAGVIHDAAFEDGRIGYPDVIAIKAQQDCGPAGQPDDFADIALNLDGIVGSKGLPDRQHD